MEGVGYGAREEAVFIYIFGSCDWYGFLWMVLPGTGYILTTDVLWDRDCDIIIVDFVHYCKTDVLSSFFQTRPIHII